MLLALDDDGGEEIADFAQSHGEDEAVGIFREWLREQVRARQAARIIRQRRASVRLVPGKGE